MCYDWSDISGPVIFHHFALQCILSHSEQHVGSYLSTLNDSNSFMKTHFIIPKIKQPTIIQIVISYLGRVMEKFKIRYSFFNKLPGICEAGVLQFCLWQVCNCEELSFVVCKEAKYKSGSWQICFQLFWNKSLQKKGQYWHFVF